MALYILELEVGTVVYQPEVTSALLGRPRYASTRKVGDMLWKVEAIYDSEEARDEAQARAIALGGTLTAQDPAAQPEMSPPA